MEHQEQSIITIQQLLSIEFTLMATTLSIPKLQLSMKELMFGKSTRLKFGGDFSPIYSLNFLRNGALTFRNPADTVILTTQIGDQTGTLCAYGVLDVTALSTITNFGICVLGNGEMRVSPVVTIQVKNS
jgi:hypothetical protein